MKSCIIWGDIISPSPLWINGLHTLPYEGKWVATIHLRYQLDAELHSNIFWKYISPSWNFWAFLKAIWQPHKKGLRNVSLTTAGAPIMIPRSQTSNYNYLTPAKFRIRSPNTLCAFSQMLMRRHWVAILTQVRSIALHKNIEEQDNGTLGFLSGEFSGSSKHWSVPDKEGFSIVKSMDRLDHLFMGVKALSLPITQTWSILMITMVATQEYHDIPRESECDGKSS